MTDGCSDFACAICYENEYVGYVYLASNWWYEFTHHLRSNIVTRARYHLPKGNIFASSHISTLMHMARCLYTCAYYKGRAVLWAYTSRHHISQKNHLGFVEDDRTIRGRDKNANWNNSKCNNFIPYRMRCHHPIIIPRVYLANCHIMYLRLDRAESTWVGVGHR